ncbi:hypothetical protein RUM43_008564, partial [Polyplax serrata]
NNVLPSGEKTREGSSITIEQTTRHQAGTYLCTASNGVGEPAIQSINLHVLCKLQLNLQNFSLLPAQKHGGYYSRRISGSS